MRDGDEWGEEVARSILMREELTQFGCPTFWAIWHFLGVQLFSAASSSNPHLSIIGSVGDFGAGGQFSVAAMRRKGKE